MTLQSTAAQLVSTLVSPHCIDCFQFLRDHIDTWLQYQSYGCLISSCSFLFKNQYSPSTPSSTTITSYQYHLAAIPGSHEHSESHIIVSYQY